MVEENMELDAYIEGPLPEPKTKRRSTRKRRLSPEEEEVRSTKDTKSREADLDEFCARFDWDAPGMKIKLSRMSPRIHNNIQIAGHLESREGGPFTLEEVKDRFGGGVYKVHVSGMNGRTGKIQPLSNKIFEIGGAPIMGQSPAHVHAASSGNSGRDSDDIAPNAQAALVSAMNKAIDRAYEGQRGGDANPDLFSEMRQSVEASAREQVQAIRESAEKENRVLREQLEAVRGELLKKEESSSTAINTARVESSSLLQTLLPTFSEQANQRAQQAAQDASDRVARMQEQFARDMQDANQRFQMQLKNMETMYQAQTMNQQTMFDGRMQQLTAEIALLRQRCEVLEGENRNLQQQNTQLLIKQTEKNDPIKIMEHAATLREASDGLFGGAGGGDGLSDGASDVMKLGHSFLQTLGCLAPAITSRLGMGGAPQQAMPPQAMPQQMPVHPSQMPPQAPRPRLAMPRQITPQQAPQPQPQPQPRKGSAKIRKQDLVAGVSLINSAMTTGTEPGKVADTAAQTLDRGTLNELVRRKPSAVYNSLQAAGILEGPLATADGSDYLEAFLGALRQRLSVGTAVQATAPQPQPEPAPEEGPSGG